MPREGTHTRCTANYAVNLRVYTRTRNNAGNFGRLHADPAATCIQPAGGRGTPRASANYVAFRVVYAGGAREKRRNFRCLHRQAEAGTGGLTDGNERKRKGRESAHARREGVGRNRGGTFACLRRFRAVSGNKRQTRTAEKVSVARFARVHLTKKSNIYFPATKHFSYFFLRLRAA